MKALRIASPIVFTVVVAACGGSTLSVGTDKSAESGGGGETDGGGGAGDAGKACATDAECGTGFACGFPRADACAAKGACFDIRGLLTCAAYSAGCACDGTEINVACSPLPTGYLSKPLLHGGKCNAGDIDGGAPCSPTEACTTPGFVCAYPEAAGCSAKGVCVDTVGVAMCNGFQPGCACDGSTINIMCNPFPNGFATKPLLHAGYCADGG